MFSLMNKSPKHKKLMFKKWLFILGVNTSVLMLPLALPLVATAELDLSSVPELSNTPKSSPTAEKLLKIEPITTKSVSEILQKADRYRTPDGSVIVETHVELYKNDVLDKTRDYEVYIKPGRRSLVDFKTPSEFGQKVLMLDDKFWMVLPKSRRPMRITPTQKLLGEASTGDIATMRWSEDYDGIIENSLVYINSIDCILLKLESTRPGTTYHKIELYLAKDNFSPVAASFYLKSGKLTKKAQFSLAQVNGRDQVVSMTLIDKIKKNRKTIVHYKSIKTGEIPDKYYNPAYLARNHKLENRKLQNLKFQNNKLSP